MLVLEATTKRQGERPDDYHWCTDGELAYSQGIDCATPGCGCNRGWAGLDSHRATTTVCVVNRPNLTVESLAHKLSISLCDGGWISAPDPSDELVTIFVDEIIEIAAHFGEGAVLEREGAWTRLRDGSNESANPFDRVRIEEMTEGLADFRAMDVLSFAAATMSGVEPFVEPLIETLNEADWAEAQILGCAIEWLATGKLVHTWTSVPVWLANLDQAEVTEARRVRGNDGMGHVVAVEVEGYELGIASFYVMEDGRIYSFFATSDLISTYIQFMKTIQRQHYKPYRKIATTTAHKAAIDGRSHHDLLETDVDVTWANKGPLFDFMIDRMTW